VFKRVAEATLRHLGVAPTLNAPPPVVVARSDDRPDIQPARLNLDTPVAHAAPPGAGEDVPDLRGLSAREALRALTKIGLTARVSGDGVVWRQNPAPGTPIDAGTTCELWLRRWSR